jgi:hypothetical protein
MEDFNALAAALGAGIADVRACLILSSDGLVLGANPDTAEIDARPARIKIAALGEPQRGFLQFGTEVWCYVRRGPYAALAVSGTAVRPGLVIDQMEQVLLAAEEARSRRETLRVEAPPAPALTTKPRTALHREPRPVDEPVVLRSEPRAAASSLRLPPAQAGSPPDEPFPGPSTPAPERPSDPPAEASPPASEEPLRRGEKEDEVDRFSLAREFSRLLQDDSPPADG